MYPKVLKNIKTKPASVIRSLCNERRRFIGENYDVEHDYYNYLYYPEDMEELSCVVLEEMYYVKGSPGWYEGPTWTWAAEWLILSEEDEQMVRIMEELNG